MNKNTVVKDERYFVVENASFKRAYNILAYGTLILIVIRSIFLGQSNWDFFALLMVSGLAATLFQIKNKTLSFSWKWIALFFGVMLLSALVVLVLMLGRT